MSTDIRPDEPWWALADDDESHELYVPLKKRRMGAQNARQEKVRSNARTAEVATDDVTTVTTAGDTGEPSEGTVKAKAPSLMQQARTIREHLYDTKSHADLQAEEEEHILEAHAARKKLAGYAEIARDIHYTETVRRSWQAPHFVRRRTDPENAKLREKYRVSVEGRDPPPLISNFRVRLKIAPLRWG